QSGFEARVVDMSTLPGSGNIGDYSYLPIRASGFYSNFWNINPAIATTNLYATPLSSGELRVTLNGTTDIYQPIRAESVKANVFEVNSLSGSSNHLYVKSLTNGEIRTTVSGTIDNYVAVRSSGFYGSFLDRGTAAGVHLYARPAGGGSLKVTVRGTTDTYRPVEASAFLEASSRAYKTHIKKYDGYALGVINSLKVVNYRLKDDISNDVDDLKIGFIAEDSEPIASL